MSPDAPRTPRPAQPGASRRSARRTTATLALGLAATLALSACVPVAFLGGALLGTGAAYEYDKKREMDRLDRAFERGEISKEEYLRRKKEIEDASIVR